MRFLGLYGTTIVGTCHDTFAKSHEMYSKKENSKVMRFCWNWLTLGDNLRIIDLVMITRDVSRFVFFFYTKYSNIVIKDVCVYEILNIDLLVMHCISNISNTLTY